MEIYFIKDGVETLINNDYIISMSQSGSLFDSQFKLGSTLCRNLNLEIDKRAFENGFDYDSVRVSDDVLANYLLATANGEVISTLDDYFLQAKVTENVNFTMRVDDYSLENDSKYNITCYDEMIYLNTAMEYDISSPKTVLEILKGICTSHNLTLASEDLYCGDMTISWSLDCSERDFLSYVAEVNGGYAYIKDNILYITPYDSTPKQSVNAEDTSGYEIGAKHLIDRVYVELGDASHYYPDTSENETCYLNSDNLLLSDTATPSTQDIVEHVQSIVNGLTFYNLKIDRCSIYQAIKTGDFIELIDTDGTSYPTIVQIDTTFSYAWKGGYELQLDNSQQVESSIDDVASRIEKKVTIKVDRELNTITQKVESVETKTDKNTEDILTNSTLIQQNASEITLEVTNREEAIDGVKKEVKEATSHFTFKGDGAYVHFDEDVDTGANARITADGFEVRSGTTVVASMSKNTFTTSNWTMEQYDLTDDNGNVTGSLLNFHLKDLEDN